MFLSKEDAYRIEKQCDLNSVKSWLSEQPGNWYASEHGGIVDVVDGRDLMTAPKPLGILETIMRIRNCGYFDAARIAASEIIGRQSRKYQCRTHKYYC